MPRYRLRTLLIVLALGPPLFAWAWKERSDLKAMAASGLDTLPIAVVVGILAILASGVAAALTVETIAVISKFHRRG